ncbi:delta(8)-fatty-acid desaturase 2-like [Vigna umbellata]|uniref:delta(8)-fatty-acid desaturase 2-like n=1 Tax=Vigna umbellata TaxID=87088 RepID=UPI001F5EECBC|nr:delta(8)-fatty-acid desaturase 2-like [Vigna umbellata]
MDPPATYISSSELRKHNTRNDAWISIHGKIYDVSSWLHRHPGGALPLLTVAGTDATDAFLAFHPPSSAAALLPAFSTSHLLSDYAVSAASSDYRKLHSKLSELNLFERKGHTTLILLSLILTLLPLCVCGVVFSDSTFVHLLSGALIGFLWIQSGWIGHDSGHYNVMLNRRFNRVAQILSGNVLAGISIAWWKWNHNAHHIACNSLDFDPDLQHLPFFVVSSKFFNSLTSQFYDRKLNFDSLARFLVSYQHWTYYPVMCFARVNLFAQSFFLLLSNRKVESRGIELLGLLAFWVWYPLLVSFLPNWWERVLFVVVSFSVTGIQHVQFCLNHFSSKVYLGPPSGGDWFEKQTNGTLDVSCSAWMDWFHGGLQFQVEHHLFPRLPRCHLRKIAPLVKDLCKKHNLPYNCVSFWKANVLTIQTLRNAALQARDGSGPAPKNLVWEAVNTHG